MNRNFAWMINKYSNEFDNMLAVTLWVCGLLETQPSFPAYTKELHKIVSNLVKDDKDFVLADENDIRQQLYLSWLYLHDRYYRQSPRPKVFIRTYLIRMTTWLLRDYIRKQVRRDDILAVKDNPIYSSEVITFHLDFRFVVEGTGFYPLSELEAYERYLLYLQYGQGRNITEIAGLMQKDRVTIRKKLNSIHNKLRRLVRNDKGTRSRRVSKAITGLPTRACN